MARLLGRSRDRRLVSEDDDDLELRESAAEAGCGLIATCRDRTMATIHGELRSVTLRPVDGVSALEAELYDGSEAVTLIWLGRRRIEGIEVGRRLTAYGRIGRRRDERIIYNPRYDLGA